MRFISSSEGFNESGFFPALIGAKAHSYQISDGLKLVLEGRSGIRTKSSPEIYQIALSILLSPFLIEPLIHTFASVGLIYLT